MNKLPTKQIYLLAIIIIGIIALSVYSTYALFTYESVTSDIVSIQTPKSLIISENIYEYQQITVEPNSITTTDIDIYNNFDYAVCYSIWYKIIQENIDIDKVQIFQTKSNTLTSSGILTAKNKIRVTIAVINDNDEIVKVNLGTVGAKNENESCSLNLTPDKNQVTSTYEEITVLNEKILKDKEQVKEEEENYITYQNQEETITYKENDKIYISDKFSYKNETFTLENSIHTTIGEIIDKPTLEKKDMYFCKENTTCQILYKITEIDKEELENETTKEKEIYYHITKYDKLIGYLKGKNGLRKVNEKDYVFYGDNPNNYIYYNCETENTDTCELWRIIGLYYNEETKKYNIKIVRNDSIGKYQFDNNKDIENLTWKTSSLYQYINEEYKLKNNSTIYLEEYSEYQETIISLEDTIKFEKTKEIQTEAIQKDEEEQKQPTINILKLSDFINTSVCKKEKLNEYNDECWKNNWLNNIEISDEWTQTIQVQEEKKETDETQTTDEEQTTNETEENINNTTDENNDAVNNNNENNTTENNGDENQNEELTDDTTPTTDELVEEKEINNFAYKIGKNISSVNVNETLPVRPVVYLKSRIILVGGDGTLKSPYIIK